MELKSLEEVQQIKVVDGEEGYTEKLQQLQQTLQNFCTSIKHFNKTFQMDLKMWAKYRDKPLQHDDYMKETLALFRNCKHLLASFHTMRTSYTRSLGTKMEHLFDERIGDEVHSLLEKNIAVLTRSSKRATIQKSIITE